MLIDPKCKGTAIVSKGYGSAYLRTADAAKYLSLGASTLERARIRGDGPAYRILGSRIVVYMIADLDEYASRNVRRSTSEPIAA